MVKLLIKKLADNAKLPEVCHKGEDLGYDLFSTESVVLYPNKPVLVPTGIAARAVDPKQPNAKFGLIIKDRSSMGLKGFHALAGVVDAGWTGEIKVVLAHFTYDVFQKIFDELSNIEDWTNDVKERLNGIDHYIPPYNYDRYEPITIEAGTKIAQMVPIPVLSSGEVEIVNEFETSKRGKKGFGSSGK